jgi:para-nitrobenzyl esterase
VPWIVGSNDFEASLFPGQVADADATLAKLPDPERRTILALYDPDRQGDTKAVVAAMITDRLLSEPARFLAAGHAQAGYPVYRYLFATVAQGQRGKAPGAGHAAELPFVFGNFAPAERHGAADRRDAVVMGLYWTNFAKTGDPNGPGLPLWQADRDDAVLVFDNSGQHTIFKLRKPQLDEMEREAGGR